MIDGKEFYQRVDTEESLKTEKSGDAEYIEGEIKDAEEVSGEEKFSRDAHEFFEKVGEGAKNIGSKIADGAKDLGRKIAGGAKDLGKKIKEGTDSLFGRDKSIDPNSTEAKLLKLLPYMNKDETHEVFEKIMAKDETLAAVDIATVMPFLTADDCDALFIRCIELGNENYDIAKAIPFVSEECLAKAVSGYISGEYDKLTIEKLYPFLPDKEIKRLFYHIISEDGKKTVD